MRSHKNNTGKNGIKQAAEIAVMSWWVAVFYPIS